MCLSVDEKKEVGVREKKKLRTGEKYEDIISSRTSCTIKSKEFIHLVYFYYELLWNYSDFIILRQTFNEYEYLALI